MAAVQLKEKIMDKMVQAIWRAPDEQVRRTILQQHARDFPGLMFQPMYPRFDPYDDLINNMSDSLLFVANLSCFGRRPKLLFRFVYTAAYEQYSHEDLRFLNWVYYLEIASEHERLSPGWEDVAPELLYGQMLDVLEGNMIEHERGKIIVET